MSWPPRIIPTSMYTDSDGLPIGPTPYTTLNRGQQALVVVPNGSKYARITSRVNPGDPVKPFYVFQHAHREPDNGEGPLCLPSDVPEIPSWPLPGQGRERIVSIFSIITEKGNEDKFLIDGVRADRIIDPESLHRDPGQRWLGSPAYQFHQCQYSAHRTTPGGEYGRDLSPGHHQRIPGSRPGWALLRVLFRFRGTECGGYGCRDKLFGGPGLLRRPSAALCLWRDQLSVDP